MRRPRECDLCLARRVQQVRQDLYGEHGGPVLAAALGLPEPKWTAFEQGQRMIPSEVILIFIDTTSVNPRWLITGLGEKYLRDTGRRADTFGIFGGG